MRKKPKEPAVMVSYRLPKSRVQAIAERARRDRRTHTAVVDLALAAYLEEPTNAR